MFGIFNAVCCIGEQKCCIGTGSAKITYPIAYGIPKAHQDEAVSVYAGKCCLDGPVNSCCKEQPWYDDPNAISERDQEILFEIFNDACCPDYSECCRGDGQAEVYTGGRVDRISLEHQQQAVVNYGKQCCHNYENSCCKRHQPVNVSAEERAQLYEQIESTCCKMEDFECCMGVKEIIDMPTFSMGNNERKRLAVLRAYAKECCRYGKNSCCHWSTSTKSPATEPMANTAPITHKGKSSKPSKEDSTEESENGAHVPTPAAIFLCVLGLIELIIG